MKRIETSTKELNAYILKEINAYAKKADKQDYVHFLRLLEANYNNILELNREYYINSSYNSAKARLTDLSVGFADQMHLYFYDGNGERRMSHNIDFIKVEYVHYSNEECDAIVKELTKKYFDLNTAKVDNLNEYTEVFYGEYKTKYNGFETLKNSYNAVTKTIFVRIPQFN